MDILSGDKNKFKIYISDGESEYENKSIDRTRKLFFVIQSGLICHFLMAHMAAY